MKRILKWIGIAVMTPVLLFIILAVLLYLPPVQNWAVKKVAAIASEKTGMEITIEHVNLEFPLDLGIEGLRALHTRPALPSGSSGSDSLPDVKDTIADIRKLVVDVKLRPLFRHQVIIDELSLQQAKINTNGFISDLRIKGEMQELWLSSKGIDLKKETAMVNGARMRDGWLDINLTDTAAVDTTASTAKWVIKADSISLSNTRLTINMPDDSLHMATHFGEAVARDVSIDIAQKTYQVGDIDWQNGSITYNNSWAQKITRLKGGVKIDSTSVSLPNLILKTPDSDIEGELAMDFNAFDEQHPGLMKMRLNAQLGKQDLLQFMGEMPRKFTERFPDRPLSIKGSINGNMKQMEFTGLNICLPTALQLTADGSAENIADPKSLKADIRLKAKAEDLNFVTALVDPKLQRNYRIPYGLTLDGSIKADGTTYGADLTMRDGNGTVRLKGDAAIPRNAKGDMLPNGMTYDADIKVNGLNLHHFMPKDSIYTITADVKAKGYGTDFLSGKSRLTARARLHQLRYGSWNLRNMSATANLHNGRGQAELTGDNELFCGTIGIDALLNSKKIEATISADLARADLYRMRIMDKPLTIGLCGDMDISSDMRLTHHVSGLFTDLYFQDDKDTYHPEKVGLLINTRPDTTYVRAQSGDLIVKLDASGDYERLLRRLTTLGDSAMAQFENKVIDQPAIKRLLPTMRLHLESKRDNPVANLLKSSWNIDFKELLIDVDTSPLTGINGSSHLYSLNYDSTRIDTIRLNLTQKGDRLSYQGQIRNNKRNPQFVFNALIDGHIHEHGALAGLRYYDDKDKLGVRLGATAEMENGGIRFKLMPDRPTLGYKEFNLNKDNYIFLGNDKKIQAKVDLISDDRTGIKLYTENQDSTMLQDLTLSIHQLDLGEVTSVIPYLPRITGLLDGDYHILLDQQERISVASDMAVRQMTYEGSPIGNISTELVYLIKEGDSEHPSADIHAVEARLMLDDEEFGLFSGTYQNEGEGYIDARLDMTRFPLSLANGFIPDQIIGFEGYAEGSLNIRGSLSNNDIDGEVYVDSAYLVSIPYGVKMRMDNDPIRITDSKLLIENFGLYAYNDEPLNLMGEVDFSHPDHITTDLRMRARNLLLINARQEPKSIAWGKAFVNFMARMQGPLEELKMRGRLDVLGSTDLTYLLLDSPLSQDNRLDELVKFTDFNDSTQTVVNRPTPSGLDIDLNINVAHGAHIICNLNIDQTNYVDLTGGGDLRMRYHAEGINLTGRYTLASGEMKYSLPVIPLKTFTVKDGSYVEFTGDPMNPKLNITATEHTKATVNDETGATRSVAFDCGVEITKTLNDMGLQFIISAPEDNLINSELSAMSVEERGKIAVAMLTTGMYLNGGTSGNFSMNSALSAFLQSEINSIAGSALKTIDISFGVENSVTSSGQETTDYSFQFSKRFLDNRLKIQIGGLLATGSNEQTGQKQSFFDNVMMEYRLNQEGTQNLKLFYKQNVYDWLEGYTSEYGAGFVWRRKLDSLRDLFRPKKQTPLPIPMRQTTTDSVKVEK